jgi:hypothetical protein
MSGYLVPQPLFINNEAVQGYHYTSSSMFIINENVTMSL